MFFVWALYDIRCLDQIVWRHLASLLHPDLQAELLEVMTSASYTSTDSFANKIDDVEGRKDVKVRQDESYLSTGDLAALNTSFHTGFAPGTHRVPASHVSTGARSLSRPCKSDVCL